MPWWRPSIDSLLEGDLKLQERKCSWLKYHVRSSNFNLVWSGVSASHDFFSVPSFVSTSLNRLSRITQDVGQNWSFNNYEKVEEKKQSLATSCTFPPIGNQGPILDDGIVSLVSCCEFRLLLPRPNNKSNSSKKVRPNYRSKGFAIPIQ